MKSIILQLSNIRDENNKRFKISEKIELTLFKINEIIKLLENFTPGSIANMKMHYWHQ